MASDPIVAAILQAPSSLVHTLKVVYAERLETPYPPVKFHVIELGEDRKLWEDHLKNAPLSDSRTNNDKRFPVITLDPSKFEYTVAEGDCVIFFEIIKGGENKVIGLVVQNLIGDKATVDALNGSVFDHINKANRMRAEDPGRMASVGYTIGSRSVRRGLAWGKNITRKSVNKVEHSKKMSALFAHVWNLALPYLPKEVIDDFDAASESLGNVCMDAGASINNDGIAGFLEEDGFLRYTIVVGSQEYDYVVKVLAPPSGGVAVNYARYTHNELNLNEYCMSYITHRSMPENHGGNFYIATFAIKIPGRADQLVVWRGSDYHGTTLARCEPLDKTPAFIQSGLSFIVPQELKGTSNRGQNAKNLSLTRGYEQSNPSTNFKDLASLSSMPKKDEGEDMLNDLEVDKAEIKMEQADSKENFESDASEDYSDIDLSAENSGQNDSGNEEDDTTSDRDPSRPQIRLDDALVQLEPWETMRIIKRRPATGKKIYAKEVKTKFYFPPNHAYSHLSIADLKLALDTREVYYATSWTKPRFIAELLKYDGVEFRSEQVVPEKGEKKASKR